jgi:hypothetical protein
VMDRSQILHCSYAEQYAISELSMKCASDHLKIKLKF